MTMCGSITLKLFQSARRDGNDDLLNYVVWMNQQCWFLLTDRKPNTVPHDTIGSVICGTAVNGLQFPDISKKIPFSVNWWLLIPPHCVRKQDCLIIGDFFWQHNTEESVGTNSTSNFYPQCVPLLDHIPRDTSSWPVLPQVSRCPQLAKTFRRIHLELAKTILGCWIGQQGRPFHYIRPATMGWDKEIYTTCY